MTIDELAAAELRAFGLDPGEAREIVDEAWDVVEWRLGGLDLFEPFEAHVARCALLIVNYRALKAGKCRSPAATLPNLRPARRATSATIFRT